MEERDFQITRDPVTGIYGRKYVEDEPEEVEEPKKPPVPAFVAKDKKK